MRVFQAGAVFEDVYPFSWGAKIRLEDGRVKVAEDILRRREYVLGRLSVQSGSQRQRGSVIVFSSSGNWRMIWRWNGGLHLNIGWLK